MKILREFKYTALSMINSMDGLFWTVCYPIILACLFFVIFSSSFNFSKNKIVIGMTRTNPYKIAFNFIDILEPVIIEKEDAGKLLNAKKIKVFINDDLSITVLKNNIEASIVKTITDQIKQIEALGVPYSMLNYNKNYIESKNEKNNSLLILFYSMLAMFSIYTMFGAIIIPTRIQANLSKLAIRISVAPIKRFKVYISGMLFYILFNYVSNILCIAFISLVLKIHIVSNLSLTMILLLYGNVLGTAIGLYVGSIPKMEENSKMMICIFSSIILSFLAGMLSPNLKIKIETILPILGKINPLAILTNNFYNINILDAYTLVPTFFIVYTGFIILFISLAFLNSKEVQYDSL